MLHLTEEEHDTLQRYLRRLKTAQHLALRARIVLRCADGLANKAVAEELGISNPTVGKWRSRFVKHRLDGLLDEPRSGAPRKVSAAQVERVLSLTLESTPKGATHWSIRKTWISTATCPPGTGAPRR